MDIAAHITKFAKVPEHSLALMEAVSGGQGFVLDDFLFLQAQDWLMVIGYPLQNKINVPKALEEAINKARHQYNSKDCYVIGDKLPNFLNSALEEEDCYYTLPTNTPLPKRLKPTLMRASEALRVEVGNEFSPAHRRLWAEFMNRAALKPRVSALFASTEKALSASKTNLVLLNAWDKDDNLAACLLIDEAAQEFSSYIIGAHSKSHYTPYAADLLIAYLLKRAQSQGKSYLHLGLGINAGIRRFKTKWGAEPSLNYSYAYHQFEPVNEKLPVDKILQALVSSGDMSKRQILASLPEQRPYAMLWKLEKDGKISYIGGAAHFFCYSFEYYFRKLFSKASTIIFEGPLDPYSLDIVAKKGFERDIDKPPLLSLFTENELLRLEQTVHGQSGAFYRFLNMESKNKLEIRDILSKARPWSALFTIWTAFLERKGWKSSVDLEAWNLAHDMGKTVLGMESLEEQIASLENVETDRLIKFFQSCETWPSMIKQNVKAYLHGDLMGMMGTSSEFPTRTHTIISKRDQRFRERMRPYIEEGNCVVFVGSAHMLNLRHMLQEDGFRVRLCLPGLYHKLYAKLKNFEDEICLF